MTGGRSPERPQSSSVNGEPRTVNEERDFTKLYVLVLAELVITIAILYAFTRVFA